MNTGIIASRYATALLKWVKADDAVAKTVCIQAKALIKALDIGKLRSLLGDATLGRVEKTDLLKAALAPHTPEPKLMSFVDLVEANGRMPELRFILNSYIKLYYRKQNLHYAKIISTCQTEDDMKEKIVSFASDLLHGEVETEESINPDLIGGIVIEMDGVRYDASVRTALKTVAEQFREQNKRII